ncbi:MAG: VCBS domain-containing protein [Alphaproteobacteria bacterium]|nr:VCBS domain-containing protein [Alphaproteobacteria bacterium]
MSSTRDRIGSILNLGLQDFGALPKTGLKDGAAINLVPLAASGHAASQAAPNSASSSLAQNPVHGETQHFDHALSIEAGHHGTAGEIVHASVQTAASAHDGGSISAMHGAQNILAVQTHDSFAYTAQDAGDSQSFANLSQAVSSSDAPIHAGQDGHSSPLGDLGEHVGHADHAAAPNAPPPTVAVAGQLWVAFGGPGNGGGESDGHSDFRIEHADSDGLANDAIISQEQTVGGLYNAIGLDTSAGLFISLDNTFHLRVTNISTGVDLSSTVVASTADQDQFSAFAVNDDTNTIFGGLFGYDYLADGGDIVKITYNQTTGAIVNPYSWNDTTHAFSINLNNVLIDSTSTGHVYAYARAMVLSSDNSTLYYVDDNDGDPGNFWGFKTNGVFKVSTTGSVGGGNAPTPTLLSSQAQFPVNDSNGYITGIAVDEGRGIIYFTTNSSAPGVNASQNAIWWMPIAGGTATKMTIPGGVSVTYPYFIGNALELDSKSHQLYYSDQSTGIISRFDIASDGHSFTAGGTFLNIDTNNNLEGAGDLAFDILPTLSSLSATTTEAVQGGSAITLLTATPTISDADNLRLNHFTITITNAQTGDNLYCNGQQSGTVSGVTVSWNSTTHQLTLSGDVAFSTYQTLLTQISYQDAGVDNSVGSHPTRTINWTASDGVTIGHPSTADSNEQTTTVVIDRAPTLASDSYNVVETATATGTSGTGGTGVLGNDSDKDGDAIAVSQVNGSAGNVGNSVAGTYGHLTLNSNGSFSYIADNAAQIASAATGSHPIDTFTYQVTDGLGGLSTSTVSFTIDRIPTVVADNPAGQALESGSAITGNVLTNDSDKDGDSLTVSAVNGSGGNVGNSIAGTYGHITINANGTYSYSADNSVAIDAAATGSHLTDTFTYTANDGHGGTATQTITVTVDRAPTVVADAPATQAVESGSAVTGNVLTNDSDRDGDTLSVSAVAGSAGNVGNSVATTYGHMTIGSNGGFSYLANNTVAIDAAATGSHLTDSITYTASDGNGGTTTTTVTIMLDRGPTVVADAPATQAVESGSAVTGNVLSNDSDRDGDSLAVSAVAGSGGNVGSSTATTYGHVTINSDGSYSYVADNTTTIDAAATGSHLTDSVTYTADDGHGGTTTTTLTVTLDRGPTVVADTGGSQALESGSAVTGNALSNDSDRDGDALTVTAVNGSGGNVGNSLAGTYGHITINANGTYSYSADNTVAIDAAATGSHLTDTFTYTASDGHGGTSTTTVTVTIDRGPTVVADTGASQAVESGAAVTGNVLTNDSDRDGDTLVVSAVAGSGANVGNSTAGTYGHFTINSNGSYSYSADNTVAIDAAATGSHLTDSVTYTASDGNGGTSTTTLTVTLDRGPTVVNDTNSVAESGNVSKTSGTGVLANDSDRDGDTLTISAVGGSAGNVGNSFATTYGHITLNADGSYSYTADNTVAIDAAASGSHPTDVVTFTVDDGFGGTVAETLTITLDRPATATADSLSTDEATDAINGSGGNPNLLANDTDKDGDSFSITKVNGSGANVGTQIVLASGALLTVNADGTYVYDPNHAFDYLPGAGSGASNLTATDTFTYEITGGSSVTVTVTINGVDSNDHLIGTTGDDTMHGGIGDDIITALSGNDTLFGDSGDDNFDMGANLTGNDKIDGGTGTDRVFLNGDYSAGVAFNPTTMVNVEVISLAAGHSYNLTTADATVAAGQTLTIQAGSLGASDAVVIDGGNETNGKFIFNTGAGNDTLTGGTGVDRFFSGAGNDTINGGGGDDFINMLGNLTAADKINGGTGTGDTLVLQGDYSSGVTFGATTVTNVEVLSLVAGFSYNITTANATVGAGQTLTVHGETMIGPNFLTFDGSAETDGSFVINAGGGDDTLTGGALADIFRTGGGTDTVHGGGGDDVINVGGSLTAADTIDGGTGNDTLFLQGDYSAGVTFGATTVTNIETLYLNAGNSYKLAIDNATVTSGHSLTVQGQGLGIADSLYFDGSADTTGGMLAINGGAGNDTLIGGSGGDVIRGGDGTNLLTGGMGADTLSGGVGHDTFIYNAVAESTSTGYDTVKGFDASNDTFQITGVTINSVDSMITSGRLSGATFDANLAAAVDGAHLGAHDAVVFTPDTGTLHGHMFLVIDVNGVAGYQAGQDIVIELSSASNIGSLNASDFTH